jgi:UDP-N-acetylglucosamine 4,6-dehydratase
MISKKFLKQKVIMITGGTGSFGKSFIKYLLDNFDLKKIIIFSRDEQKQFFMANSEEFNKKKYKNLRYFLGDVRDFDRLNIAMEGVDYVVHAAALKHVSIAEYNPQEFIRTNIIGSENIIKSSIYNNVSRTIFLSTDKAVNPLNLYGATKLAAEKLCIAANNIVGKKKIFFSAVRYGNVIGSRGSVIEIYERIKNSGKNIFPVTHKDMTRFWVSLDESVKFVLNSLEKMEGGEIFVPKLPSIKILDLVKIFHKKPIIKFTGVRPGEKLHEILINKDEMRQVVESKNYFTIMPSIIYKKNLRKANKLNKKSISMSEYSSLNNDNFLDHSQIKKKIK